MFVFLGLQLARQLRTICTACPSAVGRMIMIEDGYVLSALLERQGCSLSLESCERARAGVPCVVAAGRARANEVRVNEGCAFALDVLEALPDNGRLVQEHLVRNEGIEPAVCTVGLVKH